MLSFVRLMPFHIFKVSSRMFSKCFRSESYVLNRFLQRTTMIFPKNYKNFFGKKISFCKYSSETSQTSIVSKVENNDNNNPMKKGENGLEDKNEFDEDEDEDEDDDNDDNYDDDGDTDDVGDELLEDERKRKKEKIFEEISQGDPDILKKLKILEFEIAVLKEQGYKVINTPTKLQWEELLTYSDRSLACRIKLLGFMSLNENHKLMSLKRKQIKFQKKQEKKAEAGFHYYGGSGQTMFSHLNERSVAKISTVRHLMAEQKILIDCSYQEFMNDVCLRNTAKQIHMCVKEALNHKYPCQLEFYNFNSNDRFGKVLPKYVPSLFNENFFSSVSAQSFLDLYPKEKLVYLSPHTNKDLIKFNKDDIYIIGAFVDKGICVKASLAKAKKNDMRVARLPIDHYLLWKQGDKALPINIILRILLDMGFYDDWNIAFKNISTRLIHDTLNWRKLFVSDEEEAE